MPPTVTDISYAKSTRLLSVTFDTGEAFDIPAELLRVESPSAEIQGHAPQEKKIIPRRPWVSVIGIEPIGTYAVRLDFDDLHNTGFYTWETLYNLGKNQDDLWSTYLKNVEQVA